MKIKRVTCPIYEAEVVLSTDCSLEEIEKYILKKYPGYELPLSPHVGKDDIKGSIFPIQQLGKNCVYLLWIHPKFKNKHFVIYHECFHIAFMILNERSLTVTLESQEAVAYYIEFWAKEFTKLAKGKRNA